GLSPVAALADAADVDHAVGPDDRAVDAGLEARAVTEDRPLVLALDLLEERALQAAVGDVTEEHLPGARALGGMHRGARGVSALVLRGLPAGWGHRLVVEGPGRVGVVVEEPARLDVDELGARQPVALVVHDEQVVTVRAAPADAVRGAQAA